VAVTCVRAIEVGWGGGGGVEGEPEVQIGLLHGTVTRTLQMLTCDLRWFDIERTRGSREFYSNQTLGTRARCFLEGRGFRRKGVRRRVRSRREPLMPVPTHTPTASGLMDRHKYWHIEPL